MNDCIFCKIVKGKIAKEFKYEDDEIVAFDDINPNSPIHLLIIPKKHIEDYFEASDEIHLKISKAIRHLIEKTELVKKGYKVEVNGGGFQDVFHLHFHLLGPKKRSQ